MKYDIVPIRSYYRGIERSLTTLDFKGNRKIDLLLEKYFEYISLIEKPFSIENFQCLIDYLLFFRSNHISCEIILYDNTSIEKIGEYEISFLGIDIAYDLCESLIPEILSSQYKPQLNRNGLCENISIAMDVINSSTSTPDKIWKPCWVYTLL
jgi:hypothetical protein